MHRFSGIVAALVPCLAACGQVEKFTDAGMLDANAVDADVTIDANPPGQVTVTTHSRCCDGPSGALIAGVEVFVIQPDGTLGDSGVTNAAGTITLDDVKAGAGITAVYAADNPKSVYRNRDVVTVLGVKPGDALELGEHYTPNRNVSTGTMTVTWPATANTGTFYVYSSCGSNSTTGAATSVDITTYDNCPPTGDVVVIRTDATSGQFAGASVLRGVSLAPGATVGPAAFTPSVNLAMSVSSLPTYVDQVRFEAAMVMPGVPYASDWYNNNDVTPAAGAASLSLATLSGGDSTFAEARLNRPGEFGTQLNVASLAGNTVTAPFTIVELPWMGDQLISASAQFATWVQAGNQPYDGAVATTSWNRYTPGPDGGEGYYTGYDWTLLLPPGITTYSWTDPPAALAPHLPALGDDARGDVFLIDLASTPEYDALRGVAEWIYSDPRQATRRGELTGRATISGGGGGNGSGAAPPPLRPLLDRIQVQGTR